jgi:hypothetical protein
MPELSLDFKWYKDPNGYRLIPAKPLKRRPGQSILHSPVSDVQVARIVRNGGVLQSYRPLDISNLFNRFIDKAMSENGVLKFVETYGPLTHDGLRGKGDHVPALIDQAEQMTQALRGEIVAMPLNRLNASIVADRNGGIRLKISPACLLDALWLQLAQEKSATKFRECQQCNNPFMAGVGARRADAKFCSDKCRIEFNSLKRSR